MPRARTVAQAVPPGPASEPSCWQRLREVPPMTDDPYPHPEAADPREENFYRAMHYTAMAAWTLGVADEAIAEMREIVERALRERDESAQGRAGRTA
jgi:hypothetical protein